MSMFKNFCCMTLIAVLATTAVADEKKEKGKKKGDRKPTPTQQFVGKMDLTAEQKEKVAEIDKQYAERFQTINKAIADMLTDEQKTAQKTAQKAARDAGKKGAEARKDIDAALKLTDDQKTKMAEQKKLQTALNKEVIAALRNVLTEEQQAQLPKDRKNSEGGKKKKAE